MRPVATNQLLHNEDLMIAGIGLSSNRPNIARPRKILPLITKIQSQCDSRRSF